MLPCTCCSVQLTANVAFGGTLNYVHRILAHETMKVTFTQTTVNATIY